MAQDKDRERRDRVARGLGATRVVPLSGRSGHGPLGLLQLRAEIRERLRSSGGRPTDPAWELKRTVPFAADRWRELERLAAVLSEEGRSVSPAQLAALLVERGLAEASVAEVAIRIEQPPLSFTAASLRVRQVPTISAETGETDAEC